MSPVLCLRHTVQGKGQGIEGGQWHQTHSGFRHAMTVNSCLPRILDTSKPMPLFAPVTTAILRPCDMADDGPLSALTMGEGEPTSPNADGHAAVKRARAMRACVLVILRPLATWPVAMDGPEFSS